MEKRKSIIKSNSSKKSISLNKTYFSMDSYYNNFYSIHNDNKIHETIHSIDDFDYIYNSIISYGNFFGSLLKESSSIKKAKTPQIRFYKLNINKKLTRLDQIENNFNLSKNININYDSQDYNEEKIEDFEENFSAINKINDNFIEEESFEIDNLFKRIFKFSNQDEIIQRLEYLFNTYEKIGDTKNFLDTYIRCPLKGDRESNDYKCKCIPLIKHKRNGLVFICEKKQEKFFCVEDLLNLIINGELFIKTKKNNNFNINNNEKCLNNNDINVNNESTIKNDLEIFRNYRTTIRHIITKLYSTINYKHKGFNKMLKEYKKGNNDIFSQFFFKKFFIYFKFVYEKVNLIIYHFIINRLINEYLHIINGIQKSKYKTIIQQNISFAQKKFEYLKANKNLINKKQKNKDMKKKIFRILWITEFYLKEQIKNDIDKNIFISITLEGYVIIYLLNFHMDLNIKELYKVINKKCVDIYQPQKIVRLRCFNNNNKNEENNYFLLCSPNKHIALIINVTNNFQLIEKVQKIKFYKGLHSSVEFDYMNSCYLLNVGKEFTLWFYNGKTKILDYKEIIPKYKDNQDIIKDKVYRPINFIESRSLFIVQIISPINSIEFYKIDKGNEQFNIILINKIILEKEKYIFSKSYNNCCIVKDKYLLIGVKRNKNNHINGGIYIFNLDKFQSKFCIISDFSHNIYSLLNIRNNIIICTSEFNYSNNIKKNTINNERNNKKRNINNKINYITIKYNNKKYNKENINNKKNNNNKNIKLKDNIKNNNNLTKLNIINDNYKENITNKNINNIYNNEDIYNSNCNIINNFKNINNIKDINNNSNSKIDKNHIINNNNNNLINKKNIRFSKSCDDNNNYKHKFKQKAYRRELILLKLNENENDNLINKKNIRFSKSCGDNNNYKHKFKQKAYRRKLILLKLKENENEEIIINNEMELYGDYYTIDCNKVILDSFLLSSFRENNSVIKINEDLNLFNFCILDNPLEE